MNLGYQCHSVMWGFWHAMIIIKLDSLWTSFSGLLLLKINIDMVLIWLLVLLLDFKYLDVSLWLCFNVLIEHCTLVAIFDRILYLNFLWLLSLTIWIQAIYYRQVTNNQILLLVIMRFLLFLMTLFTFFIQAPLTRDLDRVPTIDFTVCFFSSFNQRRQSSTRIAPYLVLPDYLGHISILMKRFKWALILSLLWILFLLSRSHLWLDFTALDL